MARTAVQILDEMKAVYVTERATAGLAVDDPAQWSKVNIKRLIFYCVAFAIMIVEQMFDTQKKETADDLANLVPPSVNWYAKKCLAYQHGFPLIADTDIFDNTGKTDTEIAASFVIKYAGVQRLADTDGVVFFIRIKLCGEAGNELAQLSEEILEGFAAYLDRFQAAGDNIVFLSRPADELKMKWRIYYNPSILNSNGERLDGTSATPVKDAILAYLKTVRPDNGRYSITQHVDAVQAVQGVKTPNVLAASARWDGLPYLPINEYYLPNGGWLRFLDIDTDLEIEYLEDNAA